MGRDTWSTVPTGPGRGAPSETGVTWVCGAVPEQGPHRMPTAWERKLQAALAPLDLQALQ